MGRKKRIEIDLSDERLNGVNAAKYVNLSIQCFLRFVKAGKIGFEMMETSTGSYRKVYAVSELNRFKRDRIKQPYEL